MEYFSPVLRELILICDNKDCPNPKDLTVYTRDEIKYISLLKKCTKADKNPERFASNMQFLHEVKKTFNGTIKGYEIPWPDKLEQKADQRNQKRKSVFPKQSLFLDLSCEQYVEQQRKMACLLGEPLKPLSKARLKSVKDKIYQQTKLFD